MAMGLDDLAALLATHREARRRMAPALAALMPPDDTAGPDPAGLATLARKQQRRQAEAEQAFLADLVTALFWEDPATAPLDDTVALCDRLPGLITAPIVSARCAARRLAALGDGAGAIVGHFRAFCYGLADQRRRPAMPPGQSRPGKDRYRARTAGFRWSLSDGPGR